MLKTAICASAALVAAEYQLEWIGDYQVPNAKWDADAAENVAYDTKTNRAFLASAESQRLQVVDMSDPTSMSLIGTIDVRPRLYHPAAPSLAHSHVPPLPRRSSRRSRPSARSRLG